MIAGLHVLADEDVEVAPRARPADFQVQSRIGLHRLERDELPGYSRSTGAATSARSHP
jgi:hypothetical protein